MLKSSRKKKLKKYLFLALIYTVQVTDFLPDSKK